MKIAIVDDQKKGPEELTETLIPYLHTLDFETELCEYESAEASWQILRRTNLTYVLWTFT